MHLETEKIKELLPHRSPLLLVNEAFLEEDTVTASLYIDPDWDIFKGHFPLNPVLPGIYLTEAMAQSADLLLLSMPQNKGKLPYFAGINKMRFLRPVLPGAVVTMKAKLIQDAGMGLYECSVFAFLEEKKAAQGSILLAIH